MNEQNERLHPRLHGFAAGIIAGAAGVCVGHPFDTLKVVMHHPTPFTISKLTTSYKKLDISIVAYFLL